jgi:zinc transport system permease protein
VPGTSVEFGWFLNEALCLATLAFATIAAGAPAKGVIETPLLEQLAAPIGWYGYELGAFVSVLLIGIVCGLVGSLVVGNRMAFFSDAMAHCAFAGISLGLIISFSTGRMNNPEQVQWIVPLVMAIFGSLVGMGIAFVREQTGLASDTVIGVFFAGAIGFGAMLLTAFNDRRLFDPERFLFGGPMLVTPVDLVILIGLLILTVGILVWRYNDFMLASFNPSLARSRGVAVSLNNYIFIVLLALVVNFSISAVGVLLINAMLIVPAATASNLSRSMRQMFRMTLALSVVTGLLGLFISRTTKVPFVPGERSFGVSGTIICLGVFFFAVSMVIPYLRRKFAHLG